MARTKSTDTTNALQSLPAYDDWTGAVYSINEALVEHPAYGYGEKFDKFNTEHLIAQLSLSHELHGESVFRAELRRAITVSEDSSIDPLTKLALLHSIDRYSVKPSDETMPTNKAGVLSLSWDDMFKNKLNPVKNPGNIEEFLELAAIVDGTIRGVKNALRARGKNSVTVTEKYTWKEFRTLHKAGNRVSFSGETETFGTFLTNNGQGLLLFSPQVNADSGDIEYTLPDVLSEVAVIKHTSKTSRGGGGGKSRLHIRDGDEGVRVVNIPLVAAKLAQGKDVETIYTPIESKLHDQGHTLEVELNGTRLSVDPLTYIAG